MTDGSTRRDFIQAGATSLLALSTMVGGADAQQVRADGDVEDYQVVPYLIGEERPPEQFFEDKTYYAYIFEDLSGNRWYRTQDTDGWNAITVDRGYRGGSARRKWIREFDPATEHVVPLSQLYNGHMRLALGVAAVALIVGVGMDVYSRGEVK